MEKSERNKIIEELTKRAHEYIINNFENMLRNMATINGLSEYCKEEECVQ